MIKSQITLKQLEAFAFVVDSGTFRAAATALGTTQPNISARIAALEASLKTTLLIRDAGSVRLTAKGERLLERAREVLRAGEALLVAAERKELIDGRLRLGVTELVACTWLQGFLRRLKGLYPNLRVQLEVDLSTVIDARLTEGHLDLAFQTAPFASDDLMAEPLGIEPYCWVASPELGAEHEGKTTLEAVFDRTILTHAKHTQAGYSLHEQADARGLASGQIVHSSALSACLPMALEGLGIALLPRALVQTEIDTGRLLLIDVDWLPDPLHFFARYATDKAPLYVGEAARAAAAAMT